MRSFISFFRYSSIERQKIFPSATQGINKIISKSFLALRCKVSSLSRVRLFVTPCTVAYQAPPSMGFSRQEYWSGVPFPSPSLSSFKHSFPTAGGFFWSQEISHRDFGPVAKTLHAQCRGLSFNPWFGN